MSGDFYDHIGVGRANGQDPDPEVSLREVAAATGDEKALRAARAQELLDNPVFQEAVSRYRERWEKAWRRSKIGQVEQREQAYLFLAALDGVVAELQSFVRTGRFLQGSTSGRDPG